MRVEDSGRLGATLTPNEHNGLDRLYIRDWRQICFTWEVQTDAPAALRPVVRVSAVAPTATACLGREIALLKRLYKGIMIFNNIGLLF